LAIYFPSGIANKTMTTYMVITPKISVFIILLFKGLEFFRFYQYIAEVDKDQDGNDE
jgi:hypothetical protein